MSRNVLEDAFLEEFKLLFSHFYERYSVVDATNDAARKLILQTFTTQAQHLIQATQQVRDSFDTAGILGAWPLATEG